MAIIVALMMNNMVFVILINRVITQTMAHFLLALSQYLQVFRYDCRAYDRHRGVGVGFVQGDWHFVLEGSHEKGILVGKCASGNVRSVSSVVGGSSYRCQIPLQMFILVNRGRDIGSFFGKGNISVLVRLNHDTLPPGTNFLTGPVFNYPDSVWANKHCFHV